MITPSLALLLVKGIIMRKLMGMKIQGTEDLQAKDPDFFSARVLAWMQAKITNLILKSLYQ